MCVCTHVCVYVCVCVCVCVFCVCVCVFLSLPGSVNEKVVPVAILVSVGLVSLSVSLTFCTSLPLSFSLSLSLSLERERERERERLCPVVIQFHACAGIFKHSQSFSKTYLADLVLEQERSSVLGHFNASSNIGFILGPVVGGHLAELPGGFRYVACIAGGVFWINAGEVYCCCLSLLYRAVLRSQADSLRSCCM